LSELLTDGSSKVSPLAQRSYLMRLKEFGTAPLSADTSVALIPLMRTPDERLDFIDEIVGFSALEVSPQLIDLVFADSEAERFPQVVALLAVQIQTPDVASYFLRTLETRNDGVSWSAAFGSPEFNLGNLARNLAWLGALDFDGRVRALAGLCETAPGVAIWYASSPHEVGADPSSWRALVLDEDRPPILRMCAVKESIRGEEVDAEHLAAIVEAAADGIAARLDDAAPSGKEWKGTLSTRIASKWFDSLETDLFYSKGVGLEFRTALLTAARLPASFRPVIATPLRAALESAEPEVGRAYLQAVLTQCSDSCWVDSAFSVRTLAPALARFGAALPSPTREVVLERALAYDRDELRRAARAAIIQGKDPAHLALLGRATHDGKFPHFVENAEAAAAFLSNEAAALILDISTRTPSAEERAKVLAALEQITTYLDARARWERRTDAAAVRVNAIAQLVTMAEDKELAEAQRAEALRGLGLLGAVEELPRLVRALGSPSEAMRNAARAALDRLEQPK